ncbi:MTH1187 family thiamine-binding protein [Desulfovibrio subterraneus]|jgi:uncharacterized protein (TIGR00106 family)|uniref:Thiamine-binding protein domain-containing protein n=1 Tax=Desulfovibrio subterraneus TaxID=2718620 RepID=A0A7J0BJ83_9BACT|nr:MTH1187 family thiamine-binding protein [Desulfovibrio subterraneus]WBF67769.1 MTH1187 family thiamine-binding protein [Desulfovibrio subterraneus]GFM33608.1 hypothetical protein DSM101010T_19730 [Desulfovibrio subterraneus]
MSVIAELSIFPMDKGDSVSPYVKRALNVLKSSGLMFQLNPMGTVIEGDWDSVMAAVSDCYKALEADCDRIYMTLKIDARKGREYGMLSKVAAVE